MKNKVKLNDYRGNYVIHCRTKEDFNEFYKLMDENEREWFSVENHLECEDAEFTKEKEYEYVVLE